MAQSPRAPPPASDAGSGGSIWLTCATFQGTGVVKADGGYNNGGVNHASGGGGRVSLEYNSSTFSGAISAAPGGGTVNIGQPGTLYDTKKFTVAVSNVVITNSFQYFFTNTAPNYTWGLTLSNGAAVYFHDFTNGTLTLTNLLVTGGSVLRFDVDSTGAIGKIGINNLTITNSVTVATASKLYVADCRASFTSLVVAGGSVVDFSVCTNSFPSLQAVVVTNGGSYVNFGRWMSLPALSSIFMSTNTTLYLPAQTYTLTGNFNVPAGAVLYPQSNTNAINPASGGTTNIPHGLGLAINCRNASIDGTINADYLGFVNIGGFPGPGYPTAYGFGGSYGGQGKGNPGNGPPAGAYGSLTQPTALGSSGYYDGTANSRGAQGGGAIRINATGAMALNGTITACGNTTYSGGSGGSVWLACAAFQGNGLIKVNGGTGISAGWCGGGGGRVALEYSSSTFSGIISESAGTAFTGQTGTLFLCQSPVPGTTLSNGVSGRQLDTRFSISSNNVRIARSITRFDTSLQWSDLSTDTSTNGVFVVTNTATYTVNGLRPSRGYSVYWDGTNQFGGQLLTSTNGVLIFTNTLNMLRTFLVTPAERGTIMTIY